MALTEKSQAARDAMAFQDYAMRVSSVESYNETCCRLLLTAHAWLVELNPDGDAGMIEMLWSLLRSWYHIATPATEAFARGAQAKAVSRDFRHLRSSWRELWESP